MRAIGRVPSGPALSAGWRERREPEADEVARRAVHQDALLRRAPDDSLAATAGLGGEREASAAPAAADGAGSDLPEAEAEPAGPGPRDLPVSAAGGTTASGRIRRWATAHRPKYIGQREAIDAHQHSRSLVCSSESGPHRKHRLVLLFGSDRPGGYGGSDLYMCTRTKLGGPE